MILLGSFFTMTDNVILDGSVSATIAVDAGNEIFKGHFPDMPVVPGVCMMQIIREMMETVIEKKLQLHTAAQVKFLAPINPVEIPRFLAAISYIINEANEVNVQARFYNDKLTFFKFKGMFITG